MPSVLTFSFSFAISTACLRSILGFTAIRFFSAAKAVIEIEKNIIAVIIIDISFFIWVPP